MKLISRLWRFFAFVLTFGAGSDAANPDPDRELAALTAAATSAVSTEMPPLIEMRGGPADGLCFAPDLASCCCFLWWANGEASQFDPGDGSLPLYVLYECDDCDCVSYEYEPNGVADARMHEDADRG